jgi:hypothetical protein
MTQISDGSVAARTALAAFVRPEPFSVEVRPDRRRVLIVPHGELDLDTVPVVATRITVIDGPPAVRRIFDLTSAREMLTFETAS